MSIVNKIIDNNNTEYDIHDSRLIGNISVDNTDKLTITSADITNIQSSGGDFTVDSQDCTIKLTTENSNDDVIGLKLNGGNISVIKNDVESDTKLFPTHIKTKELQLTPDSSNFGRISTTAEKLFISSLNSSSITIDGLSNVIEFDIYQETKLTLNDDTANFNYNYLVINGIRVYVSSEEPTGIILEGSIGFGW